MSPSFFDLIRHALADTAASLGPFRAELALCATLVGILLAKTIAGRAVNVFPLMLIGSAVALGLAAPWQSIAGRTEIFTGMLVYDGFAVFMRSLILFFLVVYTVFTWISGTPNREDAGEFFVLVLSAAVGMCLMVSANHMFVVLLGIEMASVPSYVLAGILKFRRQSSEAALKFAVFGAGTAGVMLYGISLLVGVLGSAHLPTMASQLAHLLSSPQGSEYTMVLVLAGLMILVGLAFKLSAVPFHFWAPDVFEGATAEVGAFLSIASKAAALALLVRLAVGLGYTETAPVGALEPVRMYIGGLVALLAVVTCTFGNLAAYGQTNMKRMLAYSTIAHAGYMMMPVAAAAILAGSAPELARQAVAGLAFYAVIYLFMNLGAFAVTAFLRNATGSEQIADYAGLIRRSPGLTLCATLILVSLVGLPPLAGFAPKFSVFLSLVSAGPLGVDLMVIGGLNTALSLVYYLRVVRVMTVAPEREGQPAPSIPMWSPAGVFCLAVTLPLLVFFVWWGPLQWAEAATQVLF